MSEKKPTRQAEIVFAAMKAIEANGGEMRISDIYATLASSFPLTDYEKEETKSGVIRWKAYLNFYSIEVGKVGYPVSYTHLRAHETCGDVYKIQGISSKRAGFGI